MKLAIVYSLFALIASIANIIAQDITIRVYVGVYSILLSIIIGTLVGLVVKYVLDKRYIFRFKTHNAIHNGRIFMLYSIMGIATTLIFWGSELIFHYLFQTKSMRYLGGGIGLALGYITKYYLDKHFVFRTFKGRSS